MSVIERKEIYKKIEEMRGHSLITYVTSQRRNATGAMAADVIQQFTKQLLEIPSETKEVDFLIVSNGGDPTVAWRVISLLREKFDRIYALLPYEAFSAATLLALGADEIIMHPFSNLGPVDPQLGYQKKSGEKVSFGAEDLRHFMEFVREDVGIKEDTNLQKSFQIFCEEVGALPIGVAKRSVNLSVSIGEKLLNLHMNDPKKAKKIAKDLNESFFHHGHAVGRKEAKEIGLPVTNPNNEIQDLMWRIWKDLSDEMECEKPFSPLEIVMSNEATAKILKPVTQVSIPQNLPAQAQQPLMAHILQQISVTQVPEVNYELLHAALESCRCRSEFRTKGIINVVRTTEMELKVSVVAISQKWNYYKD